MLTVHANSVSRDRVAVAATSTCDVARSHTTIAVDPSFERGTSLARITVHDRFVERYRGAMYLQIDVNTSIYVASDLPWSTQSDTCSLCLIEICIVRLGFLSFPVLSAPPR